MNATSPEYRDILDILARLLLANGAKPPQLRRDFDRACRKLETTQRAALSAPDLGYVDMVLIEWFENPDYVDAVGAPRPLPLRGPRSIASLVTLTTEASRFDEVLAILRRNRCIRRTRRGYLPTDFRVFFRDDDARRHGLEALRSFLRTLDHNLGTRAPPFRLYECIGSHPAVPIQALRLFDQRVRASADAFLRRTYFELTRHAKHRKRADRTTRMGVGVYVFANDIGSAGESALLPARRRQRSR